MLSIALAPTSARRRVTGHGAVGILAALAIGLLTGGAAVGAPAGGGGNAITRASVAYRTPAVRLLRADGKNVTLPNELDDGRPVLLNFIFTTCASLCPLSSQTLHEFQLRLGADAHRVHVVSISIDPEEDTPSRLLAYARRFHAGPEWQYYTGTLEASVIVQRAFDVYRGEKMSHTPVTLMRAAPGKPWLRINGFATADELVADYRALLASS
jgi:protein SCO1